MQIRPDRFLAAMEKCWVATIIYREGWGFWPTRENVWWLMFPTRLGLFLSRFQYRRYSTETESSNWRFSLKNITHPFASSFPVYEPLLIWCLWQFKKERKKEAQVWLSKLGIKWKRQENSTELFLKEDFFFHDVCSPIEVLRDSVSLLLTLGIERKGKSCLFRIYCITFGALHLPTSSLSFFLSPLPFLLSLPVVYLHAVSIVSTVWNQKSTLNRSNIGNRREMYETGYLIAIKFVLFVARNRKEEKGKAIKLPIFWRLVKKKNQFLAPWNAIPHGTAIAVDQKRKTAESERFIEFCQEPLNKLIISCCCCCSVGNPSN